MLSKKQKASIEEQGKDVQTSRSYTVTYIIQLGSASNSKAAISPHNLITLRRLYMRMFKAIGEHLVITHSIHFENILLLEALRSRSLDCNCRQRSGSLPVPVYMKNGQGQLHSMGKKWLMHRAHLASREILQGSRCKALSFSKLQGLIIYE